MQFPLLATALATVCLALPAAAQKVQVFGNKDGERAASTQILFGEGIVGGIAVEYGQPIWQASHETMREQLKGKTLRLGKDWWTTMTTSFALDFGGTKIPAGAYLLGLQCDKDGKFSLTFLDASKGMKHGALPFEMGKDGMNWKPDFVAPLTMSKNAAGDEVEKMKMTLSIDGDKLAGTYTLAWGPHVLSADIAIQPAKKGADADHAGHDKAGDPVKKADQAKKGDK